MINGEIVHYPPPTNKSEVVKVLLNLGQHIIPTLSERVSIEEYAEKLAAHADMFYLIVNQEIVGNLAIYLNKKNGYVTSFVIHPNYQKMGYGKELWYEAKEEAVKKGIEIIYLEVFIQNNQAREFYIKQGFKIEKEENGWITMKKNIGEKNV